jgi:phasin family protein
MFNNSFDANSLFESYRTALAPFLKAQTEGLKTFERVARYQLAVTADYLDFSLSQAKATVSAKTPAEFVAQQTEIASRFGDTLRKRGQEISQIATETQGTVSQWVGEATAKVAEAAKKAA